MNQRKLRNGFTAGLLLLATGAIHAQTWTGATGSDWFTAANWNPTTVPGAASAVTIPGALSTYPLLTGNVTIAGLTMSSGSALHLAGHTFTDNGSVSLTTATVDGGGAFNVAGAGSVYISGSTLTTAASVTDYTNVSNILNNTFTGNTVISDAASQGTSNNYIDGNLFTGNLTVTHASNTDQMAEGYAGNTGDHVTGNATFNLTGAGPFYAANSHSIQVDGNLTVNRTVAGYTNLYNTAGGSIGGNFSFTTSGGDSYINPNNNTTIPVNGTFNVSAPASGIFHVYRVKNTVAGGTLSVAGANNVDVEGDTLLATVSITGYTNFFNFYNNAITGNTSIADAVTQNTGNNRIDGNLFTGDLTVTHNSNTDEMDEGYGASTNDRVTGNAVFNIPGNGPFYGSNAHGLVVNGNLTINRTASGLTNFYNVAGTVGGNFSYTSAGGDNYLNQNNNTTIPVNGTFNISAPASGLFHMYRMKNNVAGGTVSITGSTNVDVEGDTLLAPVSITGYTNFFNFYNNAITGNTMISDAVTQNTGNNRIDGNLFTGDLTVMHNSNTDEMDEGYGASISDRVTGNAVFNIPGNGPFYGSYSHGLVVNGNLTINRTASGLTNFYNVAGSVGGNFSYSSAGGDNYLNPNNNTTVPVSGTFNVSAPASGIFHVYRVKNNVAGGTLSVAGANNVDVEGDTLRATVSITGYTNFCNIYNNAFTGNTAIADAVTQNTSNNRIDGNAFTGNLTVTHNSITDEMDEGYGASTNDHVTGNAQFNLTGAGTFYGSYAQGLQVDGNLTINRTASGLTNFYNAPGSVSGNFSYTSAGGDNYLNPNNSTTVPIGGALSVSAPASGIFHMYRMKNGAGSGSVTVTGSNNVDVRNDSLLDNVAITGYTNVFYFFDNSITGNTLLSDNVTQNSGTNYIDGNNFNGNFTLVHNTTTDLEYEGYGSPSGNGDIVRGRDSIVNAAGANNLYVGYSHSHRADSTVTLNAAAGLNLQSITFGGSTGGHLRQAGLEQISSTYVQLAKTGGAFIALDTTLTVTNTMTFTSGYLAASTLHPLVFANNAVYTGASDASHVTGPVLKAGNQAFTFPTGNGASLATIGISAPATATDTVRGQFFATNPALAGYDTSAAHRAATLQRVSGCEYWDLTHVSGTGAVTVALEYGAPCGGINDPTKLRVAHYNGASWDDLGNGGTTGTTHQGVLTSASSIGTFSPFTLATTDASINPLPVTISSFTAVGRGATAFLDWIVQTEKDIQGYTIQRSADGSNWTDIGYVASAGNTAATHDYDYTDEIPLSGKNFLSPAHPGFKWHPGIYRRTHRADKCSAQR